MLRIIAIAMVIFGSLAVSVEALTMDYSGVPVEGRGGAMPVAGFGWVGYLTPRTVVPVEPVRLQVDAVPAGESPAMVSPDYLPAGSSAASLTQVPEPSSAILTGLAGLALLRRRRN
jgi:hypothetical protein